MPVKPFVEENPLASLGLAPLAEQQRRGYADTLCEILQQPATWRATAAHLASPGVARILRAVIEDRPDHIVLTGSGSSVYVGECLAPTLQAGLGLPVLAIPAGTLLTHRSGVLPPGRGLLVSIGRSGDSPESTAVVERTLAAEAGYHHLVITCNARGGLATRYPDEQRLRSVVLDPATNDRSLVMTSSFTNLVLAASGLLSLDDADAAADMAEQIFDQHADALAALARRGLDSAVYLGSGPAVGAAHEAALKMLEMSGGQVSALAESFLGLRHGPMSWLAHRPGLVVAFLSGDPTARAYETDLLDELTLKGLGAARVVVGESVPATLVGEHGVAIALPGFDALPVSQQMMLHVVVGQLLAFFTCLALGHQPDTPSQGVLTRVVGRFALHGAEAVA